MWEVTWQTEPPMRFKTMDDLIGYFICGQCYSELQDGIWLSVRKTPCGTGLSRIKEVSDVPVAILSPVVVKLLHERRKDLL